MSTTALVMGCATMDSVSVTRATMAPAAVYIQAVCQVEAFRIAMIMVCALMGFASVIQDGLGRPVIRIRRKNKKKNV